jgi:hypothetical protein
MPVKSDECADRQRVTVRAPEHDALARDRVDVRRAMLEP